MWQMGIITLILYIEYLINGVCGGPTSSRVFCKAKTYFCFAYFTHHYILLHHH